MLRLPIRRLTTTRIWSESFREIDGIRKNVSEKQPLVSPLVRTLKSPEEIRAFVNSPTWSVQESIVPPEATKEVSSATIDKMLYLSGIELSEETAKIRQSLSMQMSFIDHLYDQLGSESTKQNENNCMFRLVASDHVPEPPLDLDMLKEQIKSLKPSKEKGEQGFTIKQLKRKSFQIKKKL
ncbi:Glutamyl-tRNA(Gln) amidotransferase subunit F, mitochondrial [Candida viswanathii]|uniref:Glutamyl-tRNA(Gln) amidotransferase subunit F, mitochondrial n=1 Tax=Candida viswanathii TaxID=5486 RepID=A0A367YM56_9ASCO|nr:Glutamyl-tRNA(Gln) amidotransferase subunit F, mitochondrial [Candida viswanathii]